MAGGLHRGTGGGVVSELWTLIPAAGRSERFLRAGYGTPKPLLRIRSRDGRTLRMYEHVLERLPRENVLVALPAGCAPCGDAQIMHVAETRGQADTVLQMLRRVPDDARVLVHDCDVLLESRDVVTVVGHLETQDMTAAVARSDDGNMSRINAYPIWTSCVEKQNPVSWPLGVVGARAWLRARELRYDLAALTSEKPDAYLSSAMSLGWPGLAVWVRSWTDWGTPEAVRESGAEVVS